MHSGDEQPFSFVQMQVLWYLHDLNEGKQSPTMSELSNFLKVKPATCSQLIERLVETDLVKRENDSSDRRIIRVVLTSKGVKELAKMKEERLSKLKSLLGEVDESEIKVLKKMIDRISQKI